MRTGQLTRAQAAIEAYNRVAADGGDEPDEDALLGLYHLAKVRLFLSQRVRAGQLTRAQTNFTPPSPGLRNFATSMRRYERLVPGGEDGATPVWVVPMGSTVTKGRPTCYLPSLPPTIHGVHVKMMKMVDGQVTEIHLVDGETLEVPVVNTPKRKAPKGEAPKGEARRPFVRPSWMGHPRCGCPHVHLRPLLTTVHRFVRAVEAQSAPVAATSRLEQAVANATEARDAAE